MSSPAPCTWRVSWPKAAPSTAPPWWHGSRQPDEDAAALRDILDFIDQKALAKDPGGGRSTSYSLAEPDVPKAIR